MAAPTAVDSTQSLNEDTSFIVTLAQLSFADTGETEPLTSPGTLVSIEITQLPTLGSLMLDGVALSVGDSVTESQISNGLLAYTPAQHESGAGYASFSFKVTDSNGDSSVSPNTMTFDVAPVDDAPFITGDGTGDVTEGNVGDAEVKASGTLTASDVETDDFHIEIIN